MLDSRACVKCYMSPVEFSINAAELKHIHDITIHTPIMSTHVTSLMRR
jgi:hypothetical protein